MDYLKNISIKLKIIAGFGLMMLIILIIAASALVSLTVVKHQVINVTQEIQPAVLAASELQSSMERANSSMGLYLLSQQEVYKNDYIGNLERVDKLLEKLQAMPIVQEDSAIAAQVTSIADDVNRFKGYQETMLFLATNTGDNIPATKFATENLSPISVLLLQLTVDMIEQESKQPASDVRRDLLLDFEKVRSGWLEVRYGLLNYLTYRNVVPLREIKNARKEVESAIERLQAKRALLTPGQRSALQQFVPLKNTFFERLGEMIGIHGGEAWRTDAHLIQTEVGPLLNQVGTKVAALVNTFNTMIVATSQDLEDTVSGTNTLVATLLIIGAALGILIAWGITKVIILPLQEALNTMADIVGGEGDLTRRLDDSSRDEIGQLAHGFNLFASVVHHIVREIIGYTEKLSGSAGRLSIVSVETSRGVDLQQRKTDEVVTAITQMSATAEEVARNTTAAADAALHADKASSEGREVVGQTITAIQELAGEVQRAADVINRVESDSNAIGGVLDVIRGIAEQTNLLALNAAIEAARAGEQGRGFAVVADEVRTLASRTQESTAEIQQMIQRLQQGAHEAVGVMSQSRQRTEHSVRQAQQAGEALESISAAVQIITQMNQQIATAAVQQNAVGAEVNRAVVEISEITDKTSAGAQQTASATNELNELAEQLAGMVKQFKV